MAATDQVEYELEVLDRPGMTQSEEDQLTSPCSNPSFVNWDAYASIPYRITKCSNMPLRLLFMTSE